MEPNKLEKQFKEQLNSREIKPSEMAWEKLDALLSEAEKPKAKFPWLYVAAGFVGFLLIATLYFTQKENPIENGKNSVVIQNSVTPKTKIITSDSILLKTEEKVFKAHVIHQRVVANSKVSEGKQESIAVRNEVSVISQNKEQEPISLQTKALTVDELLARVDKSAIINNKPDSNLEVHVNANHLLLQVENDLEPAFRQNVFSKVAENFKVVKEALKLEVEAINNQLINGTITKEKAESEKQVLAKTRANNIEQRVAKEQENLKNLVQKKVDGLIIVNDSTNRKTFVVPGMKIKNSSDKGEKRTSSQLILAIGANNLVTNASVANSDIKYARSRFYEWGLTYNTRILKNDNLLHAKYGLSLMYNDLRPTDNRSFEVNGNQTDLIVNPVDLKDSRFRNVNLVVPLHLEFDFTRPTVKDDKTYFKSHNSFRLGIGGYLGANIKSKQILKYEIDGYKSREVTKGNFNTNDFIYGLSTYLGYKATSLYLKYDLNPLFKDNAVKQNNVSLGLRFDFN